MPKSLRAECSQCRGQRNCEILAEYENRWDDDKYVIWGIDTYRILRCMGCDNLFFQKEMIFSEDWDVDEDPVTGEHTQFLPSTFEYWPPVTKREPPDWITKIAAEDRTLYSLLNEMYAALNSGLRTLAAIGTRTAIDRASEVLQIDPSYTFAKKVEELLKLGHITSTEKDHLQSLIDAGSAAAHRGWTPEISDLDVYVTFLERFLERNFVLSKAMQEAAKSVPKKKKATKAKKTKSPNLKRT